MDGKTMDLTIDSVMEGIADTLNLPDEDNEINQEKKIPLDEKKEEPEEEEVDPIDSVRDLVDGLDMTAKDKKEYLKEVEARLEAGESIEDIEKEIKDATSEEEPAEEEEVEEAEETIPKAKYEKAIESMQKRIDKLTAQVKSAEEVTQKKSTTDDDRLQSMSVDELKSVKKQIRRALRHETEDDKLDQLEDLMDSVDEYIVTAPQRFQKKQLTNLEKIIPDIQEIHPDVIDQIRTGKGALVETARNIYTRTKSFQTSELGWVEAFNLATEYLANVKPKDEGKGESISSLKRRMNTLKKKTTLSGKTSKANSTVLNSRREWKRAVEGDLDDKDRFIANQLLPSMGFK